MTSTRNVSSFIINLTRDFVFLTLSFLSQPTRPESEPNYQHHPSPSYSGYPSAYSTPHANPHLNFNGYPTRENPQTYCEADPRTVFLMYKKHLQDVEEMCNAEQKRVKDSVLNLRQVRRYWNDFDYVHESKTNYTRNLMGEKDDSQNFLR